MTAKDGWGIDDVRQRCRDLRAVLAESPELATAEDLAAYWPGGAQNTVVGRGGWYYCYACYVGMVWQMKYLEGGEVREADAAIIRQAILEAFREKPVMVELVGSGPHGNPATVGVYPTSFDTLSLIDEIDAQVRWLLERLLWLEGQWGAKAALKYPEVLREVTELQLTLAWIVTTPGCGAPFNPADGLPPLPDEARRYDPLDVLNILRAHHTVHRKRLELITGSLRRTGGTAPSWATLAVGAAKALQQPIEHLMRNRSLPAWLAQAAISWDAEREARESAPQPAAAATAPQFEDT
jgi:hypothetical protein